MDRIFLAGYVPRLQCDGQLVRFLNERAGGTIPSPAMLGKVGDAYVEQINAFAKAREIPVVRFAKGDVKEDLARPHMQQAEREGRSRGGDARRRAGEGVGVTRLARRWP